MAQKFQSVEEIEEMMNGSYSEEDIEQASKDLETMYDAGTVPPQKYARLLATLMQKVGD